MNESRIWFTADSHFGHENIIKYCGRPFRNASEMDDEITRRWNEVVDSGDTVYHLGDFTLLGWNAARDYLHKLNGKIMILSNPWHHDSRWLSEMPAQLTVPPLVVLERPEFGDGKYPLAITLCHYPFAVWDRKHYGAWHLHGHSHGRYDSNPSEFIMDVGVDSHNFYPVSLGYIAGIMEQRGWYPGWKQYG